MFPIPYLIPPPLSSKEPLVSIVMVCMNGIESIHRAIRSVLNQNYRNIEFIIQDGCSIDGTLEAFAEYRDERIKVISEKDSCMMDGFHRAMKRCRGEIIGSCLADEELLPDAITQGVHYLVQNPEVGALHRDIYLTDLQGNIWGTAQGFDVSLPDYAGVVRNFHFASSFFRTSCLREIGCFSDTVTLAHDIGDIGEAQLWMRFLDRFRVDYHPGLQVKYAEGHDTQLGGRTMLPVRKAHIRFVEEFHGQSRILGGDPFLKSRAIGGVIRETVERLEKENHYENLNDFCRFVGDHLSRFPLHEIKPSLELCGKFEQAGKSNTAFSMGQTLLKQNPSDGAVLFYLGGLMERRGAIQEALSLLEQAERMRDSRAFSARLRIQSPFMAATDILQAQKVWAARLPVPDLPPFVAPASCVRPKIGFHAVDWEREEVRRGIVPLLRAFDQARFEIYCYAGDGGAAPDLPSAIQVFSVGGLSDAEFAGLARSHGLHVLVELTGLGEGHRFAALAARCAGVQIAHLNHFGTTGVPNVDYVMGDEVVFPNDVPHFTTERIWRLPVSAFSFHKFEAPSLPTGPVPPVEAEGRITFGCFEPSGYLNKQVLAVWAKLLASVPDSRLLICNREALLADERDFLRIQFQQLGLARDRLFVRPRSGEEIPSWLYDQVDIVLDPFPHGGALGLASALFHGVPAVTLSEDRFLSRSRASILATVGFTAGMAVSIEDYMAKASTLAKNPALLKQMRRGLPAMVAKRGGNDAARAARAWEEAFAAMMAGNPQARLQTLP